MKEMRVFRNNEFGEIGVLEIDGKEYFPATACAKILGYVKPHNAISQHCRYSLKRGVPHPQNPGKEIEMNFIPEGDLYRLIIGSRLPAAERFERWVFDEVLVEIRKRGTYGQPIPPAMDQLGVIVEQLAKVTAALLVLSERFTGSLTPIPEKKAPVNMELYAASVCKIDTFPEEITEQVDSMLTEMVKQQSLNFSMIARFCTMNGHPISSPSVKRYFDRHFVED